MSDPRDGATPADEARGTDAAASRSAMPPAALGAPPPAQPADAPAPAPALPVVFEPPSPDVVPAAEAPRIPGQHRGGFSRLPTAPVQVAPEYFEPDDDPWVPPPPPPPRVMAAWALACAVIGLLASLLVGWAFPIALIGVVLGIVALRRPLESRTVALWAISLGVVSLVFSAGWLFYAAYTAGLLGE